MVLSTIRGGSRILVWEEHWQGVWETEVPSGVQGRSPSRGMPLEVRRMLRHEAEKTRRERSKFIQTDTV